jgi:hypothetical protein
MIRPLETLLAGVEATQRALTATTSGLTPSNG